MKRFPLLLVSALMLMAPFPALADCSQSAAPGVNWRRCLLDGRDLHATNITGAMLRDAVFNRGRLDGANLSHTDSYRAKFISITAEKAIFDQARLIESDFTRANLKESSFIGADLRGAKLVDANMRGVDLTDAKINGADLRQTDLSGARWIDGRKICQEGSVSQCN